MPYLADTNILLRFLEPGTPLCEAARQAITALRAAGETVFIAPQNVVEFWNGATRPVEVNGFGLTPAQADAEVRQLEALFPLLLETPALYVQWRRLVVAHSVSGVQVHDARLAAIMLVQGATHLLTFNVRDFQRFGSITVVHPAQVPLPSAQQTTAPEEPS
jgi:predicted nucleic acid-binding protein